MTDKQMTTQEAGQAQSFEQAAPIVWGAPEVDIYETDNELVLLADMPGVTDQDLQLEISRGVLTLEAERTAIDNGNKHGYYRQFRLSDRVDADAGQAELKNGVLTLRLPKSEAAKPRKIAVKTLH
ncbi:MAG: Hsp20/alpha crystallin family protein [Pelovirga sp.]